MRLKKSFQLALNILFHSKLRSWLTIIGIVIGIGAVVAIVSISEGAQQQLEERMGSLGADILTITAGKSRAQGAGFGGGGPPGEEGPGGTSQSTGTQKNLTTKDINVIKTLDNVKYVMGEVSGKADISYSSKTLSDSSCTGVDVLTWKDITTSKLRSGRFLTSGDTYSIVIGQRIAESTFDTEITINSKLIINGKSFNVVGILEESSGIYMPINVARTVLDDVGNDEFDSILVKIENVETSDETVDLITEKLMLSRGILNEKKVDFSVSNPSTMQETMTETMNSMAIFLGAIAAISLLVGAIGIANSMFTSVLEKTRDIGVMKAIGAKNRDILSIFLFNSGFIGLVGGIGGIILGFLSSTAISSIVGTSASGSSGFGSRGMFGSLLSSTYVSPQIIIGSLLISILVGMVAGAIPAYRASKLNPVDALRYE
jgi:putative ABC transport system permease protein